MQSEHLMTQDRHSATAVSDRHVVQCYGEDTRSLIATVARFLGAGLQQGNGLVIIATRAQ